MYSHDQYNDKEEYRKVCIACRIVWITFDEVQVIVDTSSWAYAFVSNLVLMYKTCKEVDLEAGSRYSI
jgi:hypothetical protein